MIAKGAGKLIQPNNQQNDTAISVSKVSKSFKLPHNRQSTLKGMLVNIVSKGDRTFETQEVLKDISFEIKKGEFFGIVGRNGSGKSTLLKMLAGIYTPTEGKIVVDGSLTPFIELGVGFNPELTGRENVYLNGALLGFNNKEVDVMYDDIVRFAELERFMDQKLKNYSSGMQVRLAFSIAIRAESDILVLDEVLAVGDSAFQQKCFDYFDKLKRDKRTIVFVSHDMGAVRRYCDRCILIESGKIIEDGSPEKIARLYDNLNLDKIAQSSTSSQVQKPSSLVSLRVYNSSGQQTNKFHYGDQVRVVVAWKADLAVKNAGVTLTKGNEYIFGTNTFSEQALEKKSGHLSLTLTLNLGPGKYRFGAGLFGKSEQDVITYLAEGPEVIVKETAHPEWGGLVRLESLWAGE